MSPICSAVSGFPLPSGGMGPVSLSSPDTSSTSRLSALLPGWMTLPLSPPSIARFFKSSRKLDSCVSGPWQEKQFFRRIASIWAKSTFLSAAGGNTPASLATDGFGLDCPQAFRDSPPASTAQPAAKNTAQRTRVNKRESRSIAIGPSRRGTGGRREKAVFGRLPPLNQRLP